jgi:TldD protein
MKKFLSTLAVATMLFATSADAQRISEKSIQTIERAMNDELSRAKDQLRLQGLADPFFISYTVSDFYKLDIQASYGSLTNSNEDHQRKQNVRLMVGDYQLNDENYSDGGGGLFGGGGGPDNTLPLEDDYAGIRRSLWLSTDDLYKQANETFTKKKAALQNKQLAEDVKDLPDFARAAVNTAVEAPIELKIERKQFEDLARELSSIFEAYPDIQSSKVGFTFSEGYQFISTTEGTRTRKPVVLCEFRAQATAQAAQDGEPVSLSLHEVSKLVEDLPNKAQLRAAVEKLAKDLAALRIAPRFGDKEYTGPVLFEGEAGSQFFVENFIPRFAAKREDVLGGSPDIFGGGKNPSLKEKLNTRVLPKTMTIIDDPSHREHGGIALLGSYNADEEGTAPVKNLKLVDQGILKTLYMTRTPTKELREPNGHARGLAGSAPGIGSFGPAPGVVTVTDSKAMTSAELRKQLFERAKDNGYDFALVVRQLSTGVITSEDAPLNFDDLIASGKFIIPALIYKVDLKTGKEQLVRGAEINLPTTRDWREIMVSKESVTENVLMPAANAGPFNFTARIASSYIGPRAVLCPELEVHKKKTGANPTQPVVARP